MTDGIKAKKDSLAVRKLLIVGPDIAFNIGRVAAVNADIPTLVSFERMSDGELRLTYNAKLIPDFRKVKYLQVMRDPDIFEETELNKRAQRLMMEEGDKECQANAWGKPYLEAALDEVERLRELLHFHLVSNNDGE
jgi:hypothetical protein